ncbi:MAG TPA: ABC-F family ATP-binding cassette domain-containing protein [Sphingobium sp.]
MPAFLTLDSLSAVTPDRRRLFDNLTFTVGAERVGLVGRNGAGKSTLFHIIMGGMEPVAGSVVRGGTIGMLAQDWDVTVVISQALGVAEGMASIERIVAGEGGVLDFAAADWTLEDRIAGALAQVGLPALSLDRPMGSLSGGERMRIGMARLLIEAPDLLLLDEPTNNLDADGRAAISAMVRDWRGGMLVASHDRALLDQMDRIVELTPVGVRIFGGNWSAFAEAREAERGLAQTQLERSDADLRSTRRAMQQQREVKARRDKAGRSFAASGSAPKILLGAQAQRAENSGGRARKISERLVADAASKAEEARAHVEILTPLTIVLPPSGLPSHADLLALDGVTVAAGERLLGPWTLRLRGPERVAIAGPNGAGKTSLLRVATGALVPSEGNIRRAEGRIALLDQHVAILEPEESILANFRRLNPSLDEQAAHAACARFAFRNRDALQSAGSLSGGERLRAGLACVLAGEAPPWLLLLDEPTNHLDMDSVGILERALLDYDGALMVVSHDAAFLEAVGIERTFAV